MFLLSRLDLKEKVRKRIYKHSKTAVFEVKKHKLVYFLLAAILLGGLFVRVYRIDQILGFYFDQGRDAMVIWDFWHNGKPFLIGPTTGIAGIFRGPWYYWLIAPAYLLGGGDPVWPSVFLSSTTIIAAGLAYLIGTEVMDRRAGLLASFIIAFSYYLMLASRWLSNPTPMLLISMILVYSMYRVVDGKKNAWLFIALMLGMAMQFGSAAELFYFPVVAIFALWQRKNLPDKKIVIFSLLLLFISVVPQIIFDIRHNGILSDNIKKFLFEEESFKLSLWEVARIRFRSYFSIFSSKIWPGKVDLFWTFLIISAGVMAAGWRDLWSRPKFKILILLLLSPIVGMLFFQGNYGNIYDYYFTGYYLIFVILAAVILSYMSKSIWGKIILVGFLSVFISVNFELDRNYIVAGVDGATTVAFGNQKQAVDWIYKDANGEDFNIDAYVPPVIPHAYDYLFAWYGPKNYGYAPVTGQIELLYTLFEVDPPHPERLLAWLDRQTGIGKVIKEEKIGGITVQRRTRLQN